MARKDFIPPAAAPPPKGKALLITPQTLAALQAGGGQVLLDPTQFESITRHGKTYYRLRNTPDIPQSAGGGGGINTGAFHRTYTSETDGHTYLQGGTVTAGDGTHTQDAIKIIDAEDGPIGPEGHTMTMKTTGDGILTDGVVLPGYNLTSAIWEVNENVPDNTLPLAAGVTGKICHIPLGVFTATGFTPNLPGNIAVSYCPGSYTVQRF